MLLKISEFVRKKRQTIVVLQPLPVFSEPVFSFPTIHFVEKSENDVIFEKNTIIYMDSGKNINIVEIWRSIIS